MRSKKGGKHSLRGRVPRVFPDHRSPVARRYRAEYAALCRRFPGLPRDATVWLREAALIAVELERLAHDAALARDRRLARKPAALAQQAVRLRTQLLAIEDRLTAMVVQPPKPSILADLAAERSRS